MFPIRLEQASNPPEPEEVKNVKKLEAARAAREDANKLFKEGKYQAAFQLYERGVLILSGMIGADDQQWAESRELECVLNLNACACKLKLREPLEALNQARMVLDIDPTRWKAWSRSGEAHVQLGQWNDARKSFNRAALEVQSMADDQAKAIAITELQKALRNVDASQEMDEKKAREHDREFSQRLAKGLALS